MELHQSTPHYSIFVFVLLKHYIIMHYTLFPEFFFQNWHHYPCSFGLETFSFTLFICASRVPYLYVIVVALASTCNCNLHIFLIKFFSLFHFAIANNAIHTETVSKKKMDKQIFRSKSCIASMELKNEWHQTKCFNVVLSLSLFIDVYMCVYLFFASNPLCFSIIMIIIPLFI